MKSSIEKRLEVLESKLPIGKDQMVIVRRIVEPNGQKAPIAYGETTEGCIRPIVGESDEAFTNRLCEMARAQSPTVTPRIFLFLNGE